MKLHFEYKALEKMLTDRSIEINDAKKVLEMVKGEVQKLKANEDIVTSGFDVHPIETNYSMSVVEMKESLEKDITNGLFGTEASAGKGKGQTFASAYMAENRKLLVMESMRSHVIRAFNKIIWKELMLHGYTMKQAKSVCVKLDPLREQDIAPNDLLAMTTAGILDPQVMLDKIGLDTKAGISADEIKARQKDMLRNNPNNFGSSPGSKPNTKTNE